MTSLPVYIAVLTSKRLSDIVEVFPTEEAALAQCRGWLRLAPAAKEEVVPGLCFFAQYGTEAETVRVERHVLEVPRAAIAVASYTRGCADTADALLHLDLDPAPPEVPRG